ncbi:putative uncharacterized protein DDB_G0282133 isoform X1 [Helicoverpa zea]|uniref:putative uncharacterized protein DDB_G0282133 isoform X1 n=1 Tax=Helicoverpa zea TaxID=7113 RepID=UPI001F597F23|nr:putative uncharacterized protein DDB_G0282133 isoform X1 [Helicoverpa zea]
MAWQMPTSAQWGSGMANMAIAPDMNMANMNTYTPEQWAAMQQQNWQQWTQWQQQYAQWQGQFGEKYNEQMQAIQAMGGMPPLPPANTAPPPAPPPPDQPPPPPHENNQPLYGSASSQPAPVPAPTANHRNNTSGNHANINTHPQAGNNQNWSYVKEAAQTNKTPAAQSSVNAEALKKLAEEERLFDIQFQKWEEEIEKWRRDNVNHPDKQAYKEYEQKFEACRAQLMERRQQMKQKRARLLSNTAPVQPANTTVASNVTTAPPNLNNTNVNAFPGKQSQNYANSSTQKYPDHGNSQYQQEQYNVPKTAYNRGNNNKNIDPQDRFESYQSMSDNTYPTNVNFSAPPPSFLPTSGSNKSIPGLDLVPEVDKSYDSNVNQEVVDISEEQTGVTGHNKAPDYTTISKGINNILGDEKIMNILSMVRGQSSQDYSASAPNMNTPNMNNPNMNAPNMNVPNRNISKMNAPMHGPNMNAPGHYNYNNQNNIPYGQGNRNQNNQNNSFNNQQYDNRQNMPFNRQGQNYGGQLNREIDTSYPPPKRMHDDMSQDQYNYEGNVQFGGNNMPPSYDNGPQRAGPPHVGPPRPNMNPHRPPIRPLMQEITEHPAMNEFNQGPPDFNQGPPDRKMFHESNVNPAAKQPIHPQWIDEPLFTPSLIVEYEHKPLRLKARDFIEPVHMFDYNHKSKDGDVKRKDFDLEKEVDELFSRKPRRPEKEIDYSRERYSRDHYSRDFERRAPREDLRDDFRPRVPPRDDYEDRRRLDSRYDDRRRDERDEDRRRDDREKYSRREDIYRDRERDYRDRDHGKDVRRDEIRHRSRSRERDSRKRGLSRDSESSINHSTKKSKDKDESVANTPASSKHIVMIDDLLESPGRSMRPDKIVIILRGPPGSGKSYLAKLIRDREAEYGGTVRIMSIDDYFMQEGEVEERDPSTGKMVKKPTLKYEYDESSEETYLNSLKRAFKRSLTDGYFTFLIYDAVNDQLKCYADIWNYARQNGFQVYICTMELDPQVCFKRNIHNRKLEDIEVLSARFFPTPSHHIQLDATTLLQNAAITEVQMEDADDEVVMEDAQEPEVESVFTSKWEKMDDAAQLARLDGTSKPLRPSQLSMEDYLQLDDWTPNTAKPGKKSVRWADIEERKQQEKMRAVGFVVGQTDWNRMTDPTMGSSALTQTKYIERVRRN